MAMVEGTFDERFVAVRDALAQSLEAETDLGASVAVVLDGQPVVDVWGGFSDPERTRPWGRDTITNVWSTTKTMTFLCALILADLGELDFHAPVVRYWPEFAANDKRRVEVRHLMGHTAGLCGWAEPMAPEDLADWEKCTSVLAAQAPWWVPGTASGYHSFTQGYLIGEVVRRITSQSIGTWFAEQVARPLGADFHIGLVESEDDRVSVVVPPPPMDYPPIDPDSIPGRTFTNPPLDATLPSRAWWRRAEIPAANGHGNARSVAAVQAVVAGRGEAGGVRLLSERGCEAIFEEQAHGTDLILGTPIRFGMGYGLASEARDVGPRACYWGGYGGSVVVADLDSKMCVSYVMNRMENGVNGDPRGDRVVATATAAVAALAR